jgi:hypothetical protein
VLKDGQKFGEFPCIFPIITELSQETSSHWTASAIARFPANPVSDRPGAARLGFYAVPEARCRCKRLRAGIAGRSALMIKVTFLNRSSGQWFVHRFLRSIPRRRSLVRLSAFWPLQDVDPGSAIAPASRRPAWRKAARLSAATSLRLRAGFISGGSTRPAKLCADGTLGATGGAQAVPAPATSRRLSAQSATTHTPAPSRSLFS